MVLNVFLCFYFVTLPHAASNLQSLNHEINYKKKMGHEIPTRKKFGPTNTHEKIWGPRNTHEKNFRPTNARWHNGIKPTRPTIARDLRNSANRFEILIKASEYCKSDVKSKYCKLCVDEFRPELLRDIDMLLIFENYIQREIAELERSKNLDQILRTK